MDNHDSFLSDSASPCPDAATLSAYLSGTLEPEARFQVEHHLVDCPFCEEALQGLEQFEDPSHIQVIHAGLEQEIEERVSGKGGAQIRVLFPWRIAAAFALLAASMTALWFFIPSHGNKEIFTQNFEPYPAQPEYVKKSDERALNASGENAGNSMPSTSEKAAGTHTITKPEGNNKTVTETTTSNATSPASTALQEEGSVAEDAEVTLSSTTRAAAASTPSELVSGAPLSKDKRTVPDENVSERIKPELKDNTIGKSARQKIQEDVPAPTSVANRYQDGLKAYGEKRYSEAINQLNGLNEPAEARLYLGLSYLSFNAPEQALHEFRIYLGDARSTRTEAGNWYTALTLIRLNRNAEARSYLQKVVSMQGEFAQEAAEVLKKL